MVLSIMVFLLGEVVGLFAAVFAGLAAHRRNEGFGLAAAVLASVGILMVVYAVHREDVRENLPTVLNQPKEKK